MKISAEISCRGFGKIAELNSRVVRWAEIPELEKKDEVARGSLIRKSDWGVGDESGGVISRREDGDRPRKT